MIRHLKFCFILQLFFLSVLNLNAQKLSNILFKVNHNIISPNNDGFNDEIIFEIHLLQDREIKVKDWDLKIIDFDYKLIRSFQLPSRMVKKNKFEVVWNGKDEQGNYVSNGIYDAILTIYYDYGNITKTYSLKIEVYLDNFFIDLKFENPYITLKWDPIKKNFEDIIQEAEIRANYKSDFSIHSSFSSYIINNKKEIIEFREWEKKPKSKILWNGKDKNKTMTTGIFHYLFSYKSYENQIHQFILPGLFVIPFPINLISFTDPIIVNKKGIGYSNDELKKFDLVIKSKDINLKNLNSIYYQIYCFSDGLFGINWNYIIDGIESFSIDGLNRLISKIPENQYCLIVYFDKPIQNFKFLELHNYAVFSIVPIYIDTQRPFLDLELENRYIQPDMYYSKNFQTINIEVRDNTFIKKLELNLYLKIDDERLLLKQWNFLPQHVNHNSKKYKKKINWYGDTIQNIRLEPLDEIIVEVIVLDFANNFSRIEKNFYLDIFFKEKENHYIANISLSKIFDLKNDRINESFKEHLKSIIKEYDDLKKKYLYIRVHSDTKGNDEENLLKTEQYAEKLYKEFINELPKRYVFYRGMGELYILISDDSILRQYRNNRIEFIISDQLLNEEKELY